MNAHILFTHDISMYIYKFTLSIHMYHTKHIYAYHPSPFEVGQLDRASSETPLVVKGPPKLTRPIRR